MLDPQSDSCREPDGLPQLLAEPFGCANAVIDGMLRSGAAESAVAEYLHHPSGIPGELFNRIAADLDAPATAAAFRNWRRTLVRQAGQGVFRDVTGLHTAGVGVLHMLVWHHGLLSRRRADPRTPHGRRRFVPAVDLIRFAVRADDLAAAADRFAVWRQVGRTVGRTTFRAVVLYVRALDAAGTTRGVVPAVARRAVVDGSGRVTGFHSRRTPPAVGSATKSVYAQVRALCHDALVAAQVAYLRHRPPTG